ncbi:MAG: hypothetical protein J07HX64_00002 [halophilic archaeon J07HX64]|nr:MAG: hypothetical protein J07HX64_00002 [halophilic archaeon J07HX64]
MFPVKTVARHTAGQGNDTDTPLFR